jgi:hypothetical protein
MKIYNHIFVLLFFIATSCTESQEGDVIPLNNIRNKAHVTVKIGEVVIPDILLDTGFAFDGLMIFNPEYRDSLDLSNAITVRIGGAGSGEAATAAMLDSAEFKLGDITMTNQRILVLQNDTYKGFPSNGLIGHSVFGHYIPEFNYDKNIMTLHQVGTFESDDSWTDIPLYFKENNIPWLDVAVVIEDESPIELSVYIDYAAGDAILLLEKSDMKFNLPTKTEDVYLGRGLSGDIYGKTGTIAKVIIGPYEMLDIKAAIAPAEVRSKQDNADAILGIESLRKFNHIFDYANKKLYLKPNSHFNDSF